MGRSLLIVGAESLLGSYLAADHLLSSRESGDVVRCAPGAARSVRATGEAMEAIRHALRQLAPGEEERSREELLASRLQWEPAETVDELWCCSPGRVEDLPRTR